MKIEEDLSTNDARLRLQGQDLGEPSKSKERQLGGAKR